MSLLDDVLQDLESIGAVGTPLVESTPAPAKTAEASLKSSKSVLRQTVARVRARLETLRDQLDEAETAVREVKMSLIEIENELDSHGEEGNAKLSKKG
jgi:multidrug resistance efflux pump